MAGKKRMTIREKEERQAVKKCLQEQGILPPDKPKLNRKKYIEEAREEWNNRPADYIWELYLIRAFGYMLAKTEGRSRRLSLEAVGAAKVLKLALRLRQFRMKMEEEGRTEYTVGERLEYIRDILDA